MKKGAFSGMVRGNKQDPTDLLMKSLERAKKGEKGLESAQAAAEAFDSVADDKKDDFNMLFRELAFEMKGRATDRLKTPEEIAKEQKERLEQLEVPSIRELFSPWVSIAKGEISSSSVSACVVCKGM